MTMLTLLPICDLSGGLPYDQYKEFPEGVPQYVEANLLTYVEAYAIEMECSLASICSESGLTVEQLQAGNLTEDEVHALVGSIGNNHPDPSQMVRNVTLLTAPPVIRLHIARLEAEIQRLEDKAGVDERRVPKGR